MTISRYDKRYMDNWLFIDSRLNVREAARRLKYWLNEAASTGSSTRQDVAHARAAILATLIETRAHVQVSED